MRSIAATGQSDRYGPSVIAVPVSLSFISSRIPILEDERTVVTIYGVTTVTRSGLNNDVMENVVVF